ncbi:tetratricopeptide repeat protein [Bacteroidota bacterium]
MRNLAIILFLIIASYTIAFSQTKKIDSLITFLNSYTAEDTIRVNALIDLAQSYQQVDLEKGKNLAEEAEKISLDINYPKGVANSLYNLGFYYWIIGRNDTSIILCTRALAIFKDINSADGQMKSYNRIAVNYYLIGDYERAIDIYYICLDLIKSAKDEKEIANVYNNLGIVYGYLNDFEKALEYSIKALELKYRIKDSYSIGISLSNVGVYYLKAKNYKEAHKYLKQSLNHNTKIKNNYVLSETYQELGNLYDKLGKYDSAFYYHQKGLELVLKYGSYGQISRSYNLIGNHYFIQNNFKKALEYGTKAVNIETNEKLHILNTYNLLYKSHAKLKDYKKAYEYLFSYNQLNTELKTDESIKKLSIREKELQLKLQKEKAKLEIENYKKQRLLTLTALIFSVVLIFLISYILYLKSKKNIRLQKASETRDKMMKIISHDFRSPLISIGNTMQLIPNLIENKDYETVTRLSTKDAESVSRVLSLIDNLISWTLSQNENIPYNPEKYNLIRMSSFIFDLYNPVANYKNIELKNNIPATLEVFADKNILNTVLRNLINNAIKYTSENGSVTVFAEQDKSAVTIIVTDTGIGISEEQLNNIFSLDHEKRLGTKKEIGNGLGLFFCKEFVLKNKGDIWVESQVGKGSTFYFTVPVKQE